MFTNSKKQSVYKWHQDTPTEIGYCPDCGGELVARMGNDKIWHWAHKPGSRSPSCKMFGGETTWHLEMKQIHERMGFEIEYRAEYDGGHFRFDAFSERHKYPIREFVHSMTDGYYHKVHVLSDAGLAEKTLWIFDGNELLRMNSKAVRKGGIKNLLKPKAQDFATHAKNVGCAVWATINDTKFELWKDNVWFHMKDGDMQ